LLIKKSQNDAASQQPPGSRNPMPTTAMGISMRSNFVFFGMN